MVIYYVLMIISCSSLDHKFSIKEYLTSAFPTESLYSDDNLTWAPSDNILVLYLYTINNLSVVIEIIASYFPYGWILCWEILFLHLNLTVLLMMFFNLEPYIKCAIHHPQKNIWLMLIDPNSNIFVDKAFTNPVARLYFLGLWTKVYLIYISGLQDCVSSIFSLISPAAGPDMPSRPLQAGYICIQAWSWGLGNRSHCWAGAALLMYLTHVR